MEVAEAVAAEKAPGVAKAAAAEKALGEAKVAAGEVAHRLDGEPSIQAKAPPKVSPKIGSHFSLECKNKCFCFAFILSRYFDILHNFYCDWLVIVN